LKYRENRTTKDNPLITYHLAINEDARGPFVQEEYLS